MRSSSLRAAVAILAAWACAPAAGCDRQVAGGKADGAAVYAEACARCHGADGRPNESMAAQLGVRDLTAPELHARTSAAEIEEQIRKGSANKVMPAFAGALTEEQIAAVAAYVRSLRAD